jgi:hypothetical protein
MSNNTQVQDITFLDKLLLPFNFTKIAKQNNIKELMADNFDNYLIYMEVFLITLIIIMTIFNRYTKHIKNNPYEFLIETIIYGIVGAIPFLYMEYKRKDEDKRNYLSIFIMMFFIYIGFNILFELSGIYYFFYDESFNKQNKNKPPLEENEQIITNTLYSVIITISLILLYVSIIMIIISYKVGDFEITKYKDNLLYFFIIETLIFSLLNSVPFFLIAYNRQKTNFNLSQNTIMNLILFFQFVILHIIFQSSGFYKKSLGY